MESKLTDKINYRNNIVAVTIEDIAYPEGVLLTIPEDYFRNLDTQILLSSSLMYDCGVFLDESYMLSMTTMRLLSECCEEYHLNEDGSEGVVILKEYYLDSLLYILIEELALRPSDTQELVSALTKGIARSKVVDHLNYCSKLTCPVADH